MSEKKSALKKWLWQQRASARLAFVLSLGRRVISSAFALLWYRLLVEAMGQQLNSLFLAFQSVFSLGGLGDLGMGGAVSVRAGQFLGKGEENTPELQKFLSCSRTVFLALALVFGVGMIVLSPWLPQLLHFPINPAAGSEPMVFVIGAFTIMFLMLYSYMGNLNYACGNVTWPVVPSLVLLQCTLLGHWLLARQHAPLWLQYCPYAISFACELLLCWFYIRTSHPKLSRLLPLTFDKGTVNLLLESSFWMYLCSLGNAIYRSTDSLVINAGVNTAFAPNTLVGYIGNYKFCDLVVFMVLTASFVSLPKITQWMASPNPVDQQRVRVEMRRLNQFQAFMGCGAALTYLAVNNIFMKVWWAHAREPVLPATLTLQLAFALNMAVTASGDAGVQLAIRSGRKGLRFAGSALGLTGLLNVILSIVAMKMHSLVGIAMATVLAQTILSIVASGFTCRYLQISWLPWILKGSILPLAAVGFAGWLRIQWPLDTAAHTCSLLGVYAGLLVLGAWGLGIDFSFIRDELKMLSKSFGK